jgi:glyoxylase I family protein
LQEITAFAMSLLKHIHHIAIICSDYNRSKHFYTQLLGFEIIREVYREERGSYKLDLSLNGSYIIELFSFPSPPPRSSQPEATGLRHLAFAVDSLETALDYFKNLQIRCEASRIDEYTGKKFIFIFDPDDLPIELYEGAV